MKNKALLIRLSWKLVTVFLMVFVLDRAIGAALEHFYFKERVGRGYRTTHIFRGTRADVLIFGSSRANHHYVPAIFQDSLDMTVYNAGLDGDFLLSQAAILEGVLERYSPRIVILDIMPSELAYNPGNYDRLASLLPYYSNSPAIRSILNLKSRWLKLQMLSRIYPFNSLLLSIAKNNLSLNHEQEFRGYMPLTGDWHGEPQTISFNQSRIDSNNVKALMTCLTLAEKHSVEVFAVFSPIYERIEEKGDPFFLKLEQILNAHGLRLYNFSQDTTFLNHPDLFRDVDHLNNRGAEEFSSTFAHVMKEAIDRTESPTMILQEHGDIDAAPGREVAGLKINR